MRNLNGEINNNIQSYIIEALDLKGVSNRIQCFAVIPYINTKIGDSVKEQILNLEKKINYIKMEEIK